MIQIGEQIFSLNREDISINIDLGRMWNSVYRMINGKEYEPKFNKPIARENEFDDFMIHYTLSISKSNISDKEIYSIVEDYQNNNRKTELYLNFNVLINNELIVNEIKEEYTLKITRMGMIHWWYILMY